MRWTMPFVTLLAVVATAVVGVCELTQVRHLQYRVWSLERRKERVERRIQRVDAAARFTRTPRHILTPRAVHESGATYRPLRGASRGPALRDDASLPDEWAPHNADAARAPGRATSREQAVNPAVLAPAVLAPERDDRDGGGTR